MCLCRYPEWKVPRSVSLVFQLFDFDFFFNYCWHCSLHFSLLVSHLATLGSNTHRAKMTARPPGSTPRSLLVPAPLPALQRLVLFLRKAESPLSLNLHPLLSTPGGNAPAPAPRSKKTTEPNAPCSEKTAEPPGTPRRVLPSPCLQAIALAFLLLTNT